MVTPDAGSPPLPPLAIRLPRRHEGPEILDGDPVPVPELVRSLTAMARVNRWLGGVGPVLRELRRLATPSISLLDVGTGNAAFPRMLARGLARRGIRLRWTGVDLRAGVLAVARGPGAHGPRLVQGDARALPFPSGAFDVVLASLTLHHLHEDDVRAALREMGRIAGRKVLVSDLERHPLHYGGARLLAGTIWRGDRITRVDGPLSVLKGFTSGELLSLAHAAGLPEPQVRRNLPFRLLLSSGAG